MTAVIRPVEYGKRATTLEIAAETVEIEWKGRK